MATSTGKTLGLIVLILLILLVFLRVTPFFLGPFLGFPMTFLRNFELLPPQAFTCHIYGLPRALISSIVPLALFILWIVLVLWVYRDAERRGMNGVLWALLVFISLPIGLLIYLIVRAESPPRREVIERAEPCPNCAKPVLPRYTFCPHCGTRLQVICPNCEEPAQSDWAVCPHCGEKLVDERKAKK